MTTIDQSFLTVKTIQESKTFYFTPKEGWKRGETYLFQENQIITEVNQNLGKGVVLNKDTSRYFQYKFTAANDTCTDFSTTIAEGIKLLFRVAEENELKLTCVN